MRIGKKNWNNCEGRLEKLKFIKKKIQKIVFDKFGKTQVKPDRIVRKVIKI